jgi:hypothetical protein
MNCVTMEQATLAIGFQVDPDTEEALQLATTCQRLARYCGRDDWGPSAERTEYHDGGHSSILPHVWPVTSIRAIYDDTDYEWLADSLLASDEYVIDPRTSNRVLYKSGCFTPGDGNIKLVYTAGYANESDVPAEIQRAALIQFKQDFQGDKATGQFTPIGEQQSAGEGEELLDEVKTLLSRWKRTIPFA